MLVTMWSAIFFRMMPIFSMRTFSPGWKAGGGAIGARAWAGGWTEGAAAAAAPPRSMNAVMSRLVTRPEIPVPVSLAMSMPWALAMLRTSGEERVRRRSDRDKGPAGSGGSGGSEDSSGSAGPVDPVGFEPPEPLEPPEPTEPVIPALFSPFTPITPTTLLTGTVSPSLTLISRSTPAPGDGISASTLSVEISKSGSSLSIGSPTFLIQRTIVPSAIDSPIWGITTSVAKRCLR